VNEVQCFANRLGKTSIRQNFCHVVVESNVKLTVGLSPFNVPPSNPYRQREKIWPVTCWILREKFMDSEAKPEYLSFIVIHRKVLLAWIRPWLIDILRRKIAEFEIEVFG